MIQSHLPLLLSTILNLHHFFINDFFRASEEPANGNNHHITSSGDVEDKNEKNDDEIVYRKVKMLDEGKETDKIEDFLQ